ncbi:type II toxin-antitoxin system Phd/YefM family antitoxin [Nocardia stercoris]|nr:hypothetical protein [Nocardia stercoris]
MAKQITDSHLREHCAEVLDELDAGQEFVIIRDGHPIGELHATPRRREITTAELQARLALFPWNDSGNDVLAEIDAVFPF